MPACWAEASCHSWVDPGVNVGQAYIDHLASVVSVRFGMSFTARRVPPKLRLDTSAIRDPANHSKLFHIVAAAPVIPWEASADSHAAVLVSYLQHSLQEAFPKPPSAPTKSYLQPATWELHARVSTLRRQCARLRSAVKRHFLAAALSAWRMHDGWLLWEALCTPWQCRAECIGLLRGAQLRVASSQLKRACKADRAAFISSLADQVQSNTNDSHAALQRLLSVRQKKPFTPEVLPQLRDAAGNLCIGPQAITDRWRQHFGDMEGGRERTPGTLCDSVVLPHGTPWPEPLLAELPGPCDLILAMAHTKSRKAAGPDAIPGELYSASAGELWPLIFPLVLKFGLLGEEGAGLKGSLMAHLYKHRGPKDVCSSYRAIMLLPTLTKVIHRSFRPRIYDHVMEHTPPNLLGGKRGMAVAFGSQIVRSFLSWKRSERLPACVLFADVSSAYYSSVRELAARREGVSVVPAGVSDGLRRSGASRWLEAATAELHRGSWFTLRHDSTPVETFKGSRPGSSLADLVYSAGLEQLLARRDLLRRCAPRACAVPRVPWDGRKDFSPLQAAVREVALSDVIWADDLAECLEPEPSEPLAAQLAVEASTLDEAFAAFGYMLSYGRLKTAALAAVHGAGARSSRRALFGNGGELHVFREDMPPARMPLVESYRHLGVIVSANGSFLPELKARVASAWTAFRLGRTKVYRCRHIAVARRGALLATMVLPRLLFGAGAWPRLRAGEARCFHSAVSSMYRQALCVPRAEDQHISGAVMCSLLGLVDPDTLLKLERLRYARQLVASGPPSLWALLRLDAGYVADMRAALSWMYGLLHATIPLGSPEEQWSEWVQLMTVRPGRFKGWVKRCRELTRVRLAAHAAIQLLRKHVRACGSGQDLRGPGATATYPEVCIPCRTGFVSRVAWSCHAQRKHGYRTLATLVAGSSDSTWCRACGKRFANAARMKRHVYVHPRCQRQWGDFVAAVPVPAAPPHPQAPPEQLPAAEPVEQPQDPSPIEIHEGLLRALLDLEHADESAAWELVQSFIAPISHLRATVRQWALHSEAQAGAAAVSSDLILLLDPDLLCEAHREPRDGPPSHDYFAPPPGFLDLHFPLVLSGTATVFSIDAPPLMCFVFPFQCSVPLRPALRHLAWLEAACVTLCHALSASRSSPVEVRFSVGVASCLEPALGWFCQGGFQRMPWGLRTPGGP